MAKRLNIFKGTIEVISGFRPKNGRDYPLMEAHDIVVDEAGTRLDDRLANISADDILVDEDGTTLTEKLKTIGDVSLLIDPTLSKEGLAADAKAVGDRITKTLGDINSVLKRI